MKTMIGLLALALVAGCSSTTGGGSSSGASGDSTGLVEGAYLTTFSRDTSNPGNCPASTQDPPETMIVTADGQIQVQSLGGVCQGSVSGNKVTAACVLTNGGQTVGNIQYALTFTTAGVTGSLSIGKLTAPTCTGNLVVSGTRK